MASITEANRTVARALATALGARPEVRRYHDDSRESSVGLASLVDHPVPQVTTFATIGLSDHPLPGSVKPPLGVELMGVCTSKVAKFANVIATAAFFVINNRWRCEPGSVFPNVVTRYLDTPFKHLMFVPPFYWDDLQSRVVEHKTVAWLLAVPISDTEFKFVDKNGSEALEDLLERNESEIFDLNRPSVA